MEKEDSSLFKQEVVDRKIEHLLHFTPSLNLLSIFEQGCILSRSGLEKLDSDSASLDLWEYIKINDKYRIDNLPQYINTSVQNINYALLQRFRHRLIETFPSWSVVIINKELIWSKDTLFSVGNAASNYSKSVGINGTFSTFQQMFSPNGSGIGTHAKNLVRDTVLRPNQPTDIQAEVLVQDKIPLSSIQKICFESEEDRLTSLGAARLACSEPLPEFVVDQSIFAFRG